MAFVNEYASDEDIEKYGLKEIWDRYFPNRKNEWLTGGRPALTIDHDRNTFLLPIGQGSSGSGNRTMFLLYFDGHNIRADLELTKNSSKKVSERPFFRDWNLAYLNLPGNIEHRREEIVDVLKDAVVSYGYRGVSRQIPSTQVSFNF
jgi:hypothetical protein